MTLIILLNKKENMKIELKNLVDLIIQYKFYIFLILYIIFQKIGQDLDDNGDEIVGSGGYKYFGATRDLPGVKELFENQHIGNKFVFVYFILVSHTTRKSKYELNKCVDVDYYGYRKTNDLKIDYEAETEFELKGDIKIVKIKYYRKEKSN